MQRRRILGAIAFPSFVLAWTAAAVVLLLQLQPAGAVERWTPAWERGGAPWQAPLPAAPGLDERTAWRDAAAGLAGHSEVLNGSWQPAEPAAEPTPDPATAPAPIAQIELAAPAATNEAPAATNKAPAAINKAPAAMNKAPAAMNKAPAAMNKTPAAMNKTPAAMNKTPAAMTRAPAARNRAPAASEAAAPPVAEPARLSADTVTEAPAQPPIRKTASIASPRLAADKAQARRALQAGRFAEAYGRLRPGVAGARDDTEYLGLLALAALHTGSPGEALVLYQRLAGLEPDSGRWRVGLALAQERLGLDAAAEYRQALARSEVGGDLQALLRIKLSGGGPPGIT